MDLKYYGYTFTVEPKEPATEILIAQLGFAGFESFVENEDGVTAYIQEGDWNADILNDIQILNSDEFKFKIKEEDFKKKDDLLKKKDEDIRKKMSEFLEAAKQQI